MQIKDYLKQNGSLNQLVEKYVRDGYLFTTDNREIDLAYATVKGQCDDSSGEAGYSEIFSFDASLTDYGALEVKLYFNNRVFFADALRLYEGRLTAEAFIATLDVQGADYKTYLHTDIDDEGVILLDNGVMARFNIIDEVKIVYQIECNFALYPEFADGIKKTIAEKMKLI
ncbi:hypothetical protein ACLPHD_11590 [Serratia odorifera]|uniref:hypothetical protein n=1 Tax=Serratia odorifera TaxID=618 RepID=UPI00235EDEC5|nr:hypothetical protein [Serratia odorifera]